MVLDIVPVPGQPTIWMMVGQGPIALAIGAKYCIKGPLNPKQPTNQSGSAYFRCWSVLQFGLQ